MKIYFLEYLVDPSPRQRGVFDTLELAQAHVPYVNWVAFSSKEMEGSPVGLSRAWWALVDDNDEYGPGWAISEWEVRSSHDTGNPEG